MGFSSRRASCMVLISFCLVRRIRCHFLSHWNSQLFLYVQSTSACVQNGSRYRLTRRVELIEDRARAFHEKSGDNSANKFCFQRSTKNHDIVRSFLRHKSGPRLSNCLADDIGFNYTTAPTLEFNRTGACSFSLASLSTINITAISSH
jgi:hypothetical protein